MDKTHGRTRLLSKDSTSSSDSGCSMESPAYEEIVDKASSFKLFSHAGEPRRVHSSRKLAMIAIILSSISLIAVVACAGYAVCDALSSRRGVVSEYERVCLPCIQVSSDPLDGSDSPILHTLDTHKDEDGDSMICCAHTPAQYAALFKLILDRQEAVKKLADILGPSAGNKSNSGTNPTLNAPVRTETVSAHLLIDPKASKSSDHDAVQAWKSPDQSPLSHVREGLVFQENKLYVKREGLYFVYCQILYSQNTADHHKYPTLSSNYVKRRSVLHPPSSGILLKARHTRFSDHVDDRHSSYVAGLFFLRTGDELFVQVATPGLIAHDDRASFFGLFQVG